VSDPTYCERSTGCSCGLIAGASLVFAFFLSPLCACAEPAPAWFWLCPERAMARQAIASTAPAVHIRVLRVLSIGKPRVGALFNHKNYLAALSQAAAQRVSDARHMGARPAILHSLT